MQDDETVRLLPREFLERYFAKDVTFMGHLLTAYSREELMAIAAAGWDAARKAREDGLHAVQFMAELHRAAR